MVGGSTHLISIPKENIDLREELAGLPYETWLMMNMVSKVRWTPVYLVKPHNLWRIDDSTKYCFARFLSLSNEVKLTLAESDQASGTDLLWVPNNNSLMKGIRVAMTCGFLASGTSLPIIACVSRLGEQELPGRDSLILKIPGFCIGRGANVSNKEIGHVLFIRNKFTAVSSAAEVADRCFVLKGIKQELSCHTVRDIPPSWCPVKRRFHKAF